MRWPVAVVIASVLGSVWVATAAQDLPETEPFDSGLVERTGISLIVLDVVVADENGKPIPGLTKDDFEVELNGIRREIYRVDDLCPVVPTPGETVAVVAEGQPEAGLPPAATETVAPAPREPERFILFFDFGQMRMDGRLRAVEQAGRWVREVMAPDDVTMIVAHTSPTGLVELAPFTSDKERLIEAIDRGYEDPRLVDSFPMGIESRLGSCCIRCGAGNPLCCNRCCPTGNAGCDGYAWDEFTRARHSLLALRGLLERMDEVPGRKALLLFQQNGTHRPEVLYSIDRGDHVMLLDDVAAEATLTRTTIHTAYTGDRLDSFPWAGAQAVNTGANLADYTGGSYNRGVQDLGRLVDRAGRDDGCIYRIGIRQPPGARRSTILRARVTARGRFLPNRYRVTALDELDRWWRRARNVLADPGSAQDVYAVSSIVPRRAAKGRWEVSVQVAIDTDALFLMPAEEGQVGSWEVGAMLVDDGRDRSWEMLGQSKVLRRDETGRLVSVLHERTLDRLKPGEYELRAFVRDRVANQYGGAITRFVLPEPGRPAVTIPLVSRTGAAYARTLLPLRTSERKIEPQRKQTVQDGSLPLGRRDVVAGEPLEFTSWICPGTKGDVDPKVLRYIAAGDEPLFRLPEPRIVRTGDCVQVSDALDTAPMPPGEYTYLLQWTPSGRFEPLTSERSFVIVAGGEPGEEGRVEP